MSGDRHNSSAELLAQGVANLVVPLVGGIPVTGAIARTATNYRSGAKTPVAGMVHAVTLLVIVLLLAPLAIHVPLATLAAVLFVVAYNMGEWREIGGIWRLDWTDKSVWMITFALTVMADLTIAVETGIALAALLYIYRVTETTERLDGHARVHRGRTRARAAGQGPARLRHDPAHPRPVPVRDDRQAAGRDRRPRRVRADRHPAAAEHERHRRDRAARPRAVQRPLEAIGADAGAVRRPRSAGRVPRSRPSSWSTWAGRTSCRTCRRRWSARTRSGRRPRSARAARGLPASRPCASARPSWRGPPWLPRCRPWPASSCLR